MFCITIGRSLVHHSRPQADRDFVLPVVERDGRALAFVSEDAYVAQGSGKRVVSRLYNPCSFHFIFPYHPHVL